MGSKSIEFFSTPKEYADLIYEFANDFNLNILIRLAQSKKKLNDRWETKDYQYINPEKNTFLALISSDIYFFRKIFLSQKPIEEYQLDPKSTPIGKWQWLTGTPPKFNNGKLNSGDLGARSDWYIPSKEDYGDNRDIFDLFLKIKRRILKRVKKPMWIVFSPTDIRLIRDVGYTKEIEELSKKGVVLKGLSSSYEHVVQEPKPQPK